MIQNQLTATATNQLPVCCGLYNHTINTFDFLHDDNRFKLFIITVVFRSKGYKHQESRWLGYYQTNVLQKIKRMLVSSRGRQQSIIPVDWLVQYELDERSLFTSNKSFKYPHHVHGVLPIPVDLVHRIYDADTGSIHPKLRHDLETTQLVSSVDMQLYDESKGYDWLHYMLKSKSPDQYSWNH